MRTSAFVLCVALAACAAEPPFTGKPVREGRLASGETYRDYSRQPYGYFRVTLAHEGKVLGVRDLHTEQNFRHLQPGMTPGEVEEVVGVSSVGKAAYANRTTSWTYRYSDVGIAKLLHVIFGPDGRVLRYETEWDPDVYSKKGGGGSK
jgi:hypothetical protein